MKRETETIEPLVRSIGLELVARIARADEGVARMLSTVGDENSFLEWTVETGAQLRALRRIRDELFELGCTVLSEHPLSIRFPIDGEGGAHCGVWTHPEHRAGA